MRSDDFEDLEALLGGIPDLEPGSVLEDEEDYPAEDAAEEDVDVEAEAPGEPATETEEAVETGEIPKMGEESAMEAGEIVGDAAEMEAAGEYPEGGNGDSLPDGESHEPDGIVESGPDEFDDIDETIQADGGSGKKRKVPIPLIIVLAVCVVVLGVAVWQLSNIFIQYNEAENEYEDLLQYVNAEIDETDDDAGEDEAEDGEDDETVERVALSLLQAQNSDTVGWIEIPGTVISYPLMHTTDNSYYLNHTFSGKVNSSGCIFVETLNSGDFTDLHTIIYGHNMKNGSMFAILKNYASASYLVAHPIIYIDLEDGTHAYQIFSVHSASSDDASFTIGFVADEEYEAFLEYLKESSDYDTGVTVSVDDYIITLSTCTNSGQDRYLVHAKKLY